MDPSRQFIDSNYDGSRESSQDTGTYGTPIQDGYSYDSSRLGDSSAYSSNAKYGEPAPGRNATPAPTLPQYTRPEEDRWSDMYKRKDPHSTWAAIAADGVNRIWPYRNPADDAIAESRQSSSHPPDTSSNGQGWGASIKYWGSKAYHAASSTARSLSPQNRRKARGDEESGDWWRGSADRGIGGVRTTESRLEAGQDRDDRQDFLGQGYGGYQNV